MALFVEKSFPAFVMITVVLGGGAAFMTGRAMARNWRPFWHTALYILLLGLAVRFLHWGLFLDATFASWRASQGTLLSVHYYLVDTLVLLAFAGLGYRLERTRQMTRQYRWLYRRTSPLTWEKKSSSQLRRP